MGGLLNSNSDEKSLKPKIIRLVFIVVLAVLMISFIVQFNVTKGNEGHQVFFENTEDTFMDFFNVQKSMVNREPYDKGMIYPPLAYLIVYPMHPFCDYGNISAVDARMSQSGVMSYIMFMAIWMVIGAILLSALFSEKRWHNIIIIFLLFLSAPMLFLLERGNIVVAAVAFIAFFFAYFEDDNRILREAAIIALAFAVGIKLYPAIFGVLLIKKGRILSLFRCALYSLALIILPFLLFKGGLNNLGLMLENIGKLSNGIVYSSDTVALSGALGFQSFFRVLCLIITGGQLQDWYSSAYNITSYVMLAFSVAGSFFVKLKWQKAALLTCPMILFPVISGFYNLVLMFIPIVLFLDEKNKRIIDYVYLLLFIVFLNPVQYGDFIFRVSMSTIIANVSIIAINLLLFSEGIISFVKKLKQADKNRNKKLVEINS